jgi:hypothetical protein
MERQAEASTFGKPYRTPSFGINDFSGKPFQNMIHQM